MNNQGKNSVPRPVIGLVPLYDEKLESYWMLPGYMSGLEQAGAVPVMLPLTQDEEEICLLVDRMDGFLVTGGHDMDPSRYGQEPDAACGVLCRERDGMEQILLARALEADKPVFGICRGIQSLNVFLGGTLYQDLPTQRPSQVEHHMTAPYDQECHRVTLAEGGWLHRLLGVETIPVNSYHHQAVKDLAPGLKAAAWAPDGLVEAVELPGKRFVAAVQWHPEFSWKTDANSREIFRAFADACRRH